MISKNKKKVEDIINLIPMINLIFLLLIFFLLTGVVQKKEIIQVEKPESLFAQKIDFQENSMNFIVDANGNIFFNNKKISTNELASLIRNNEIKIFLELDKNSKIVDFNKILKSFKEKNVEKVFIKVLDSRNKENG